MDRQILPGKIVVRNAAGSPRQRQQGPHHGPGQHIQQHQHQCQRHKEQPQIHPGQLLQLVGLCTVSGVLLLQCGLRQPEGVLGEVIRQFHPPVHLVHIGIRRRGHLQKGVPALLVARIALQQVPGAGVAVLADLFIIKGQLRQAGFGDLAGRLILLRVLPRGLPHHPGERLGLRRQRILHGVTGAVIGHHRVKGGAGPPPHSGSHPDRHQRHG